MKSKLLEDSLGSMLYKFFTQYTATHEKEDYLIDILWRAVQHYRSTGEFSMAVIVCPQYSADYTQVLSGVSMTAYRAVNMYKMLKKYLRRHISYGLKVHFRIVIFDQEQYLFDYAGIDKNAAKVSITESVLQIRKQLRLGGQLSDAFSSDILVGADELEWKRLVKLAREDLLKGEIPENNQSVFQDVLPWYQKVLQTDDITKIRPVFDAVAQSYLAAGHFLRNKYGRHTLLLAIENNNKARMARYNIWQPPEEKLVEHPSLIRIKDPSTFDPELR